MTLIIAKGSDSYCYMHVVPLVPYSWSQKYALKVHVSSVYCNVVCLVLDVYSFS